MSREPIWMELDDELAAYFRALAEDVPEPDPKRLKEAREHYRAMIRALRPRRRPFWESWLAAFQQPVARWALAFAFLVAFLFTGGAAVVQAAEQSRPGSPLYTVKIWQENFLLMRARDPQVRAQLHQRFAQRRIEELRDLLAQGQQEESMALLENLLNHVDSLAQLAQEKQVDARPEGLAADVQVLASVVDPAYQKALLQALNTLYRGQRLVGVLAQRQGTTWAVDGTQVVLTSDTLVQGVPKPGDVVEIIGHPLPDGRWQAQWIRVAARAEGEAPFEISVIGEVAQEGGAWRIDGHVFDVPREDLLALLSPGALVEVHLQWDPQRETWVAVKVEPKASYKGQVREMRGRIEALAQDAVRVNGQWWPLLPETQVEGTLQVGVEVEIEVWQDTQGQWHVVEIEVEDEEEERYEHEEERYEEEEEHEEKGSFKESFHEVRVEGDEMGKGWEGDLAYPEDSPSDSSSDAGEGATYDHHDEDDEHQDDDEHDEDGERY